MVTYSSPDILVYKRLHDFLNPLEGLMRWVEMNTHTMELLPPCFIVGIWWYRVLAGRRILCSPFALRLSSEVTDYFTGRRPSSAKGIRS
ncbi:hypothetical protein Trydic_g21424 [Trypoxylus dichotomus]